MDEAGRVVVASHAAVAALTRMRDEVATTQIVPAAALTWQEEHTRFAFQNGQAAFMRNWPYAYRLLQDAAQSTVAGRVAIAPMPGGPSGAPTAALGGSVLAVNRFSADQAEAYALVQYLLEPEQLLERTRIASQFPPRPSLYDMPALEGALPIDPREARRVLEHTVARPATPVYTELSEALQIALHEALTGQRSPRAALTAAASSMQAILDSSGLGRPSHAE
jgi:multiple sugar transport system substrate-binding protein